MIDREKVKNALERCLICDISVVAPEEAQNAYRECEYTVGLYCGQKKVLQDAHDLLEEQQQEIWELQEKAEYLMDKLKEQETEWEHLWDEPDGTYKGRCKRCGFVYIFIEHHDSQYNFCPSCGRKVKWDDPH